MAFEESTQRPEADSALDLAVRTEKQRKIAAYQAQFKRDCPCHCHLEQEGIWCGCIKNCEHCRLSDS